MNEKYYSKEVVSLLQSRLLERRNPSRRPLFVFSCGGKDDATHVARNDLKAYIESSRLPSLNNVICLKAEAIAEDQVFGDWDLLTQEAIIADVADWLIVFAESCGSFCELGAFASLPHIRSITSVAVDKQYKGEQSFLMQGPVKAIAREKKALSKVFYLDLMCPLLSVEFTEFVNSLRDHVNASEKERVNKKRKMLNNKNREINLGSLVHELLDLAFLCNPILENDLIDLYWKIRGYSKKKRVVQSRTLANDMHSALARKMTLGHVISFMVSSGMLSSSTDVNTSQRMLSCNIVLHDYFMFKADSRHELANLKKRMALDKRRDGIGKPFYHRHHQ